MPRVSVTPASAAQPEAVGAAPHRAAGDRPVRAVRSVVARTLDRSGPVVLAVSGGRDSMVLLDAALAAAPGAVRAVAVFDHGTGAAAREGVALVRRVARGRGVRVVVGRERLAAAGEAAWREARWRFLRRVARAAGARAIATGHHRDDQVETVAMRVLRGSGARGLAGMAAATRGIARPLLGCSRRLVAAYAAARGLAWVEDPSNGSRRFLRNRLRHELLPALERARPGTTRWLLALGQEAAGWRREVDAAAGALGARRVGGALVIPASALIGHDAAGLGVLWAALAARAGARLDRRGTVRLVEFTMRVARGSVAAGAVVPLAGGHEVVVHRGAATSDGGAGLVFVLRRAARTGRVRGVLPPRPVPLTDGARFGRWCFRRVGPEGAAGAGGDAWSVELPGDRALVVRAWRPGDRLCEGGVGTVRRVKRYLSDARVAGAERRGWPVVTGATADGGEEVLWIPGIRRSHAVTDRPGGPGPRYICDCDHGRPAGRRPPV